MTHTTDASSRLLHRLIHEPTFQLSVDTGRLDAGLRVAEAGHAAGVTIIEMGTPLLKAEGTLNVVPAFRRRFPDALLLADMKTMDGGGFEARIVFEGGANIIDVLALAGTATVRGACGVRDELRRADPAVPRLVFADILLPNHPSTDEAVAVAMQMVEAGVDGVGVHLQSDARRIEPALWHSGPLPDTARAVFAAVGDRVSVQVVGGLSVEQALPLRRAGLNAFVISANLGVNDGAARYDLPPAEMQAHIAHFIRQVGAP